LYALLPHTTHLLQPLDVGCFQPLKWYHSRTLDWASRTGAVGIRRSDFLATLAQIRGQAFKENTIKSGWRKTGLAPFSPEQVIAPLSEGSRGCQKSQRGRGGGRGRAPLPNARGKQLQRGGGVQEYACTQGPLARHSGSMVFTGPIKKGEPGGPDELKDWEYIVEDLALAERFLDLYTKSIQYIERRGTLRFIGITESASTALEVALVNCNSMEPYSQLLHQKGVITDDDKGFVEVPDSQGDVPETQFNPVGSPFVTPEPVSSSSVGGDDEGYSSPCPPSILSDFSLLRSKM
ncbi:transposase, partial [Paraphaeosphaeria sporulosa]